MSRFDSWLGELQPEMFVEISPELAGERGVANGDWVVVSTPRGEIEARALVTERLKPSSSMADLPISSAYRSLGLCR